MRLAPILASLSLLTVIEGCATNKRAAEALKAVEGASYSLSNSAAIITANATGWMWDLDKAAWTAAMAGTNSLAQFDQRRNETHRAFLDFWNEARPYLIGVLAGLAYLLRHRLTEWLLRGHATWEKKRKSKTKETK